MSYMRFYTRWPAVVDGMLLQMEDAITLDPLADRIFDFGKSKFEIANHTLSDESLLNAGV